MAADIRQTVASGKPYPVLVPPTGAAGSLDLFVGDAEFTLDGGSGAPMLIRGHGVAHGDVVRFHQKDHIGGKDVRVWHVRDVGSRFEAEAISAF
jgi:hypothetical protein